MQSVEDRKRLQVLTFISIVCFNVLILIVTNFGTNDNIETGCILFLLVAGVAAILFLRSMHKKDQGELGSAKFKMNESFLFQLVVIIGLTAFVIFILLSRQKHGQPAYTFSY